MKSFLEKLGLALEQLPLPEKVVCYGVAFSGGLDSSVLLAGLVKLDHRPVRALHVNHGLHNVNQSKPLLDSYRPI